MNQLDLAYALNEIDDAFVEESAERNRKYARGRKIIRIVRSAVPAAAAAVLLLTGVLVQSPQVANEKAENYTAVYDAAEEDAEVQEEPAFAEEAEPTGVPAAREEADAAGEQVFPEEADAAEEQALPEDEEMKDSAEEAPVQTEESGSEGLRSPVVKGLAVLLLIASAVLWFI